jgi:hypothetical protein
MEWYFGGLHDSTILRFGCWKKWDGLLLLWKHQKCDDLLLSIKNTIYQNIGTKRTLRHNWNWLSLLIIYISISTYFLLLHNFLFSTVWFNWMHKIVRFRSGHLVPIGGVATRLVSRRLIPTMQCILERQSYKCNTFWTSKYLISPTDCIFPHCQVVHR